MLFSLVSCGNWRLLQNRRRFLCCHFLESSENKMATADSLSQYHAVFAGVMSIRRCDKL